MSFLGGAMADDPILDILKNIYDLLKHLTTIDTGAIVILATFFSNSFANASNKWLVIFCLIAISISLIFCVLGMYITTQIMFAGRIRSPDINRDNELKEIANKYVGKARIALLVSIICFITGILLLVAFVISNILV
jgi:hypothetical protein